MKIHPFTRTTKEIRYRIKLLRREKQIEWAKRRQTQQRLLLSVLLDKKKKNEIYRCFGEKKKEFQSVKGEKKTFHINTQRPVKRE